MPHNHVIRITARKMSKTEHVRQIMEKFAPGYPTSSSTIQNPPSKISSIDTPLLSRTKASTFTRKTGINKQSGTVYPQKKSPDDSRHHPEFFYVEWPAASENLREIHAPTLAAISGNSFPRDHKFSTADVAALIAAMHTIAVPQLLHACRPK